jgi:predicted transcriptional regulator of viral defense system
MAKTKSHVASRPSAERALAMMAERGMVRLREFKAAGIPEMVLARLTRAGRITRLARGLYQLPNADLQATHTFAEVAKIVPKGVICLISALGFHALTLQLPPYVWVAIETHTRQPKRKYPPMRFVRFSKKGLIEGVQEQVIEGAHVKITGPARTIVDCFRFRRKIGIDIAVSALREALAKRRCSPDEILTHAQSLRVASVIRPYLEALTLDG